MWIRHVEVFLIALWPVVPLHAQEGAAESVEQRVARRVKG